jgi:hypothetical protein
VKFVQIDLFGVYAAPISVTMVVAWVTMGMTASFEGGRGS